MKNNDNSPPSVDVDSRFGSMFTRKKIYLSSKLQAVKMNPFDEYYEEEPPKMQQEVLKIQKETHRLAVVNMNWRNAKAADLYALFYSLVAPNGLMKIKSVAIYPTYFGLHRMKEIKEEDQEELRRQIKNQKYIDHIHKTITPLLIDRFGKDLFNFEQQPRSWHVVRYDDDPWKCWPPDYLYDSDERSRYYFAMVECDSCATALEIYKQNDGVVFEYDGNPLDLRFIPDYMDFENPQDVATVESLTPSLVRRYSEQLLVHDDQGTDSGLEGTDTHLKLFLR